MEHKCQEKNICFQRYQTLEFANKKKRRFFPDQPSLSRYLKGLDNSRYMEEFWNLVLFAHALYLKGINMLEKNIKLIADYTDEACKKNKDDPYCFGKKDGKTKYKTLTFSMISGSLHQVIANFKIKKRQDTLPLFEKIIKTLCNNDFNIIYMLIDRGFYRKRLLSFI
ncbi:hypothetical protein [Candidatus Harpocratesius sp.]